MAQDRKQARMAQDRKRDSTVQDHNNKDRGHSSMELQALHR